MSQKTRGGSLVIEGFALPTHDVPRHGFVHWIRGQLPLARQAQKERLERYRQQGGFVPGLEEKVA